MAPTPPYTEEEYLRLDRQAETRSEFHDGQMFAMAGGSPNHSLLANSIGAILRPQVPAECRVFNADLRIRVVSAKTYDRGKKFEIYRAIPSFREYLIVQSERVCVEHYCRQKDGSWLLREHQGMEAAVTVGSLGVRISLADLYASTGIGS